MARTLTCLAPELQAGASVDLDDLNEAVYLSQNCKHLHGLFALYGKRIERSILVRPHRFRVDLLMIPLQTTLKFYERDICSDDFLMVNSRLSELICTRNWAADEYNSD